MRTLIVVMFVLVPVLAWAQPGSAGSGSAGSASAGSAVGSAGSGAGSATAGASEPTPMPAPAQPGLAPTADQLRKTCAEAMNADPSFADSIVKAINEDTFRQHARAASAIAKNERHVVLAYAAMWVLAAGFVIFLWRRQQALRREISQLRRDLDAAVADEASAAKAPTR